MRYLTLAEALITAEAVTGTDAVVLARANDYGLHVEPGEAVETLLAIAAGELDEAAVARWLGAHLGRNA